MTLTVRDNAGNSPTPNDSNSKACNDSKSNKQVANVTRDVLFPIEKINDVTTTEKNDIVDALDNIEELEGADKLSFLKKKEKTTNALTHFDFFL